MTAHLGPAVTAFIDGELDHDRRDEVLAHLAHCEPCRLEVDGLRRFTSALRGAGGPAVPPDLAARLLAAVEPVAAAPARTPHRSRRQHTRFRRAAMSGAIVALGIGGALSLAGPPPRGPLAPVDPTSQRFMIDHASTSGEVPFTELAVVSVSTSSSTSSSTR